MSGGKVIAIVFVLVLFAVFVPIFPHDFASANIFGFGGAVSANVSLSYIMFSCGTYNNLHSMASGFGVQVNLPASASGYHWICLR